MGGGGLDFVGGLTQGMAQAQQQSVMNDYYKALQKKVKAEVDLEEKKALYLLQHPESQGVAYGLEKPMDVKQKFFQKMIDSYGQGGQGLSNPMQQGAQQQGIPGGSQAGPVLGSSFQGATPGTGSRSFNIGNIRSGPNGFKTFGSPEEGVYAAADLLRRNYRGMTLEQIGNKWAPPSENDTPQWIRNVAAASGLDPRSPLNLDDRGTLQRLISGIGTAEKGKADLAMFTPESMSAGIGRAMQGGQQQQPLPAMIAQGQVPQPGGQQVGPFGLTPDDMRDAFRKEMLGLDPTKVHTSIARDGTVYMTDEKGKIVRVLQGPEEYVPVQAVGPNGATYHTWTAKPRGVNPLVREFGQGQQQMPQFQGGGGGVAPMGAQSAGMPMPVSSPGINLPFQQPAQSQGGMAFPSFGGAIMTGMPEKPKEVKVTGADGEEKTILVDSRTNLPIQGAKEIVTKEAEGETALSAEDSTRQEFALHALENLKVIKDVMMPGGENTWGGSLAGAGVPVLSHLWGGQDIKAAKRNIVEALERSEMKTGKSRKEISNFINSNLPDVPIMESPEVAQNKINSIARYILSAGVTDPTDPSVQVQERLQAIGYYDDKGKALQPPQPAQAPIYTGMQGVLDTAKSLSPLYRDTAQASAPPKSLLEFKKYMEPNNLPGGATFAGQQAQGEPAKRTIPLYNTKAIEQLDNGKEATKTVEDLRAAYPGLTAWLEVDTRKKNGLPVPQNLVPLAQQAAAYSTETTEEANTLDDLLETYPILTKILIKSILAENAK